jgi:hypothetical protein
MMDKFILNYAYICKNGYALMSYKLCADNDFKQNTY